MNGLISVAGTQRPLGGQPFSMVVPAGYTLAQIVDMIPDIPLYMAPQLVVCINGEPIPVEWWSRVKPKPDGKTPAIVNVYLRVQGGGGGGRRGLKNILSIIATIAVAAAALFVSGGALGPLLGQAAFGAGTLGAKVAAGAIGVIGSLLVSSLFKPPVPTSNLASDPTVGQASLSGNVLARGAPLARVAGTLKVFPPIVSPPLTEAINDDEVVEAVFGLDGPHRLQHIRVNEVPISEDPLLEVQTREGVPGDPALTLVTRQGFEETPNVVLSDYVLDQSSEAGLLLNQTDPASGIPQWSRFITRNRPDEVWLTLMMVEGLLDIDSPNITKVIPFRIRFRQHDNTQWINGPELHLRNRRDSLFRRMIKIVWGDPPNPLPAVPSSGWYRAFKSVPIPLNSTYTWFSGPSGAGWTAHPHFDGGAGLQTVANVAQYQDHVVLYLDPVVFPKGVYEIELIRGMIISFDTVDGATYVLSGDLDVPDLFGYVLSGSTYFSFSDREEKGRVHVSKFASVWNELPVNRNTALIGLRGKNRSFNSLSVVASGLIPTWDGAEWGGLSPSSNPAENLRFVLAGERTVYPLPAQQLDEADLLGFRQFCLDNGLETNLVSEGRSTEEITRIIAGTGLGLVRPSDKWGVVWEHDRNMEVPVQVFTPRNSRNFSWSNQLSQLPGGLVVSFLDRDQDYQQTELLVYADGVEPSEELVLEQVSYDGITSVLQAIIRATFDMRQARLRNVVYSLEAALEAIVCSRGSLIGVQHDVIVYTAGYARIKEVLIGSPDGLVVGLVLDSEVPVLGEPDLNEVADLTQVEDMTLLGLRAGLSISLKTGPIIAAELIGSPGDTTTVFFAEPFELVDGLEADCLVTVGVLGQEYQRMLVVDIRPRRDMTAQLTLIDEAPSIHPLIELEGLLDPLVADLTHALIEWSEWQNGDSFELTLGSLVLDRTVADAGGASAIWNEVPARRSIDVLAKLQIHGTPVADGYYGGVLIRSTAPNSGYLFELVIRGGQAQIGWRVIVDGQVTELLYINRAWSPSTNYWLRVSAFGTKLIGKLWSATVDPNVGAWDISTLSFTNYFKTELSAVSGIFIKPDGTTLYVCNTNDDRLREYNLSTPWDLSSASFVRQLTIGAAEDFPRGVFFRDDGAWMVIIGIESDSWRVYSLSTPWNVSTASLVTTRSVAAQDGSPQDTFFRSDGLKAYVVGSNNDRLYEYNLSTPWDVSTSSFVQFISLGAGFDPGGLHFRPDGEKLYVVSFTTRNVVEYDLSTPWDISTAVINQTISLDGDFSATLTGVHFRDDGLQMFVTTTSGHVYQYSLGQPVPSVVPVYATSSAGTGSTLSNVRLGNVSSPGTRQLVLVLTARREAGSGPSNAVFTNIDVAGETATILHQGKSASDLGLVCIAVVNKPAAAVGTVTITLSGATVSDFGWGLAVLHAIGVNSVPIDLVSGANDITVDVPPGGFAVVGAATGTGSPAPSAGSFSGAGAETLYAGTPRGASMVRKSAGNVLHDSSGCQVFRGVVFEFAAAASETEESAIPIEITDTTLSEAGFTGLSMGGDEIDQDVECDYFAVGFNMAGDAPAPEA